MSKTVVNIAIVASIIILAIVAYIFLPALMTPPEDRVPFSIIDRGVRSDWIEQANFRIDTEKDFMNLWEALHGNATNIPEVDFDREFIIVAFLGVREKEGYGITVAEVRKTTNGYNVVFKEETPGDGCINTPAALTPYVIARVPRRDVAGPVPLESTVISVRTSCTL